MHSAAGNFAAPQNRTDKNRMPVDLDELQAAYDALMDGEPQAHDRLCLCLQPLVKAWANYKKAKHWGMYLDRDELASVGNEAVLLRIDRLASGERRTHKNLKGFFSDTIRDGINKFLNDERLIRVPRATRQRTGIKAPKVGSLVVQTKDADGFSEGFAEVDIDGHFEPVENVEVSPLARLEYYKTLKVACRDETDARIVAALIAIPYIKQAAIAATLGLTQPAISMRLQAIKERYKKIENNGLCIARRPVAGPVAETAPVESAA